MAFDKTNRCLFFFLLGWAYLLASYSFAQSQPSDNLLRQNDAGKIEERFNIPELPKAQRDNIVPETSVPEVDPNVGADIKFTLEDIQIKGNTVFSDSDLKPLYADVIGEDVSLAQVYGIVQSITVKYRDSGYILSQAFLPPQTIENGVVIIQVIEGFIDEIVIEDETYIYEFDLIQSYGSALLSGPLKAKDLERFVLLTNDLPGVSSSVILKPSENAVGAANLILLIELSPYDLTLSADNRGTRYVGPIQTSAAGYINSFIYDFSRLGVRHIGTSQRPELEYYELSYEIPFKEHGDKLSFSFTRSLLEPGYTLKAFDIESESKTFILTYEYPVIRSREENLSLSVSYEHRSSKSTVLDSLQSEDRIRSVKVSASYDFIDSTNAINLIQVSAKQGLNIFNASEPGDDFLTRTDGKSDFTKINFNYFRLQRLLEDLNLFFSASGQYSFDQLLSAEEFGFGGPQFGRAYDPSEISGDHGIAASVEARYQVDPLHGKFIKNPEVFAFYDIGAIWRIDPDGDTDGVRKSGSSTGLGTRAKLPADLNFAAEMALPLTRDVEARSQSERDKGDDVRFFFTISKSF